MRSIALLMSTALLTAACGGPLSNFILVRVRPMGSGDRLGIEVKEIVP